MQLDENNSKLNLIIWRYFGRIKVAKRKPEGVNTPNPSKNIQ